MNIIAHESHWFPAMPSIINTANWSADKAASLHREAPAMNFTGHESLYHQTRDSPSVPSADLKPRHQYWLPEVIRLCNVINPHLISSPKKILSLSVPILFASLSHGCQTFTLDWHHPGNGQRASSVALQVSSQVTIPHTFSRGEAEMRLSKTWFSFLSSDTQKVLPPSCLWGLLGCMLLQKW